MEIISSVSNEKVKFAVKIATSSKLRKEKNLFFLEGLRLCYEAYLSQVEIEQVFFTQEVFDKNTKQIQDLISNAKQSYIISDTVAKKISLTQSTQGIFCVCQTLKLPNFDLIDVTKKYVALENVQDPSNLGAIARTAEALGIKGIIMKNCCDMYNPKSQRAAMGSLLRLPIFIVENLIETLEICKSKQMKVYATTPQSDAKKITSLDLNDGVICVIGNEGNGVSDEVFGICEKITIPMLGRAESLNASVAATITMWEMTRQ